jgi:hypothetical protein
VYEAVWRNLERLALLEAGEPVRQVKHGEHVRQLILALSQMSPAFVVHRDECMAFGKAAAASNASSLPIVMWKRPRGSAAPVNSTTTLGEKRWATSVVPSNHSVSPVT